MHYFGFLGKSQEQVLERVDPILDAVLEAHAKEDYERFSGWLQQDVRQKITESQFKQAAAETNKRLGEIQGRRFLAGLRRDDRPMLLWAASFSNTDNDILISMIFEQEDARVAVNWFWLE